MLEQPLSVNNQEKRKYNFPEIMEAMKPGLVSLTRQLKDAIESGEYQTLISDDTRGRIPTLILRKIFKAKAPNARDLQTYFLALGRSRLDWDSSLEDYIKENKSKWGKTLIITEFIHSGNAVKKIWINFDYLNHFDNYDIAAVFSKVEVEKFKHGPLKEGHSRFCRGAPKWDHELFIGEKVKETPAFLEGDSTLKNMGGVERRKVDSVEREYDDDCGINVFNVGAFPERIDKLMQNPEPTRGDIEKYWETKSREEQDSLISMMIKNDDKAREETRKLREQKEKVQLSEEELKEIQDNINKAREDVDTVAQEIMTEVWAGN